MPDTPRSPTLPRARRWVAALMLAAVGACVLSAPPAPAATAATASGCGHSAASGSTTLQIQVAGHRRVVIVHIPAGYRDKTPAALVLNLHGSGSTASQQEIFSGMDTTADADHFIVAYPQGLIG